MMSVIFDRYVFYASDQLSRCWAAILATAICLPDAMAQDRASGDRVFKQLDRNGDDRITPEELPIPRAFEALDGNGGGAITSAEARAAVAEMSPENRRKLGAAIEGQLKRAGDQPTGAPEPTDHRASYSKDLQIHVGVLGVSDGRPLAPGRLPGFTITWPSTAVIPIDSI